MEFFTAFSEKRPIRLCDNTRQFAFESMQGKYGDDAMKKPFVSMDDTEGFENMSQQEKYNTVVMKIAKEAPIRICQYESVSGAATLGEAIHHVVPAFYRGKVVFDSISHLTVDFKTVIFKGIDYLEGEITEKLCQGVCEDEKEELLGMKNVIDAMRVYHSRYLSALKEEKNENYNILKNVPFSPAESFKEAVQSLWFSFSFLRLLGNWPGIGRIDEMLGGFLKRDLEAGSITLEEAREFLAGMFIKGCEWIESDTERGSGDAQHYQNIILGGIDEDGREVTNEVTYLVLDIVEELGISDFPITVRVNGNTPEELLKRVSEVIRYGGGIVAVYNESLIIDSLTDFGYDVKTARRFANDGCWEVQIPGETYFGYVPFDCLNVLLDDTLGLYGDAPCIFESYEEMYSAFCEKLTDKVRGIYDMTVRQNLERTAQGEWIWKKQIPCSAISLFERGCIERGRSYLSGGANYNLKSPHIGGAPDVGNCLFAIDKLVFKEKMISFAELLELVRNDWEGEEALRRYVRNKLTYYGNDNDEADGYTVCVLNDFADIVSHFDKRCPIRFPSGVSTFGRQIEWSLKRGATPFGSKKGEILSGNASPTPNTDFEGATAVIRSYCKADLKKHTSGAALDVKLHPSALKGENGVCVLCGLIKGFLKLGGFFMQLDVVDMKVFEEARKHPENYKTLSVRVSGWNARFVTLNEKWQQMIIEQSCGE